VGWLRGMKRAERANMLRRKRCWRVSIKRSRVRSRQCPASKLHGPVLFGLNGFFLAEIEDRQTVTALGPYAISAKKTSFEVRMKCVKVVAF
jgi:hypothetical protein